MLQTAGLLLNSLLHHYYQHNFRIVCTIHIVHTQYLHQHNLHVYTDVKYVAIFQVNYFIQLLVMALRLK